MPESYVEKTQRWVTLCANAEPLIGPLPAAQELHSGLKATTLELGSLEERIQDLEGQTLTLTMKRQELIRKGIDDADRLKFHLRAIMGPKNPELLMLGIRPRRPIKAKPKVAASAKGNEASEAKSVSVEA